MSGKLSFDEAYNKIHEYFDCIFGEEFESSAWNAIKIIMQKDGYGDLIPIASQWGREILQSQNPTETRARFKKAYEVRARLIEKNCGQLRSDEPVSLKEILENVERRVKEHLSSDDKAEIKL